MSWTNTVLIVLAVILSAFIGFNTYTTMAAFTEPITLNLNGVEVKRSEEYYGSITDLTILGKRFADHHTYNLSDYDCKNYSKDFFDLANHLGFDVEIETACRYENMTECHAYNIVRIAYEPQSGEFRDMELEYPYKSDASEWIKNG